MQQYKEKLTIEKQVQATERSIMERHATVSNNKFSTNKQRDKPRCLLNISMLQNKYSKFIGDRR